ncbi:pilin biogenesis protein [Pseudoalteromonas rubra]|uniref:Pilin biogenesis protein n=2 Tax=Pseudoalteromonas rubra TaxID=43658 RepID=A0A5S3WLQ6_9GAMM|nr:PilC/PilY family type IV pilus protein [Pseudoalteromonas rubra]TMP27452.1 pilin biogenesis protein [Pseudoalteromonas rubra]TMP36990.1 pilin biogenesis protein [Pseudoalteromonas rubra]
MWHRLLGLLSCICMFSVQAEDIELFVKHDISNSEKSRVLVVFDTSGSMAWDVKDGQRCYEYRSGRFRSIDCFDSSQTSKRCYKVRNGWYQQSNCGDSRLKVAQDAITTLVDDNPDFDIGLMRLYSSSGGYVLNGLGASTTTLKNKIANLPASGSTPLSETLWEAYLYLTGKRVLYGQNKSDRDRSVESNGYYISPFKPDPLAPKRCDTSTNIILMTDGDPTSDSARNTDIYNKYVSTFGSVPSRVSNNYLNSLAKVMRGTPETQVDLYPSTPEELDFARTYTIGFGTGMSNAGKTLLEQTALDGGGEYKHANTASELSEALKATITNIREKSDSFSSPSVSTSSSDLSRSGDSIYYTMFYPETHTRWRGNLKKLKVKGAVIHGMGSNSHAINEEGVIADNVTTYWSQAGSKDGSKVGVGGVNYQLSRQTTRKLYSDYGKGTLMSFDYATALIAAGGNLSKLSTMFSVDNAAQVPDVINWSRGIDVNDENNNGSTNDRRDTIFGDPLHSRPVTLDYGNGDLRVIVGTNAGFLHMFKDNGETVKESWAFVPGSLLDILRPQMVRQDDTKLYGMDGPITVYFWDKNDDGKVGSGERVWLIAGMRRGGNEYYGFDITSPDNPRLLWGGPIKGGSAPYEQLAQTWSKPLVTFIKSKPDTPVVIFGAGYDTNKDNALFSNDSIGRGIYIVDIETGKPYWSLTAANGFTGQHSIAADLSTVDSDYDGYTDRIYATDTGGGIWRFDMPGTNPSDSETPWTHFKLASLSGGTDNNKRRFFYRPVVARTYFSKVSTETVNGQTITIRRDIPYEGLLIGSGNRAKPTSTAVQDFLYMVRDENTKTQSFIGDNVPATIKSSNLLNVTNDPFYSRLDDFDQFVEKEVELGLASGWKLKLAEGEKAMAAATIVAGVAYYTTFTPASVEINECSITAGRGRLYALHLNYGMQMLDLRSFQTTAEVPDTPRVHFSEHTNEDGSTTIKAQLISPIVTESSDDVIDGKIRLVEPEAAAPYRKSDGTVGGPIGINDVQIEMQTRLLYIYKKEEHDEKN